jgi:diacylglycerol kinase (ATP)
VRWTAIVNPEAGRGRTSRLLPELRAACAARDIDVHVSTDADEWTRIACDAFARGDGAMAFGGDGTIAAIAGVTAEAGGALAVVPTGAGNDFARHLGIDKAIPLAALDLVDDGRIATVDLARATDADGTSRWCTTVANTGFDADANRWANGVRHVTGTSLYVLATLRTIAVYRPQPVVVRVDDEKWSGAVWLVAAGNTRCYAGGMMITPDAEIDDGLLDVCIIGPASLTKFATSFPTVFKGRHTEIDEVVMLRGKTIEIEPDGGDVGLELWASGERVGLLPGRVEVVPGALRVLVPNDAPVQRA